MKRTFPPIDQEVERMRELLTSRMTATGRRPSTPELPSRTTLAMSQSEDVRRLMAALGNYRPQFAIQGDTSVLDMFDFSALEVQVEAYMQRDAESMFNTMVYGFDLRKQEMFDVETPTRAGKSKAWLTRDMMDTFLDQHWTKMPLRTFRRITELHTEWMQPRWDYVPDKQFKNHRIETTDSFSIFPRKKK